MRGFGAWLLKLAKPLADVKFNSYLRRRYAEVAELVDAHVSGACALTGMRVRLSLPALAPKGLGSKQAWAFRLLDVGLES